MFGHVLKHDVDRKIVVHWFLLAFLAGNVNAGGYLACHRFVTHLTGFSTLFGVDVAQTKFDAAVGILSVPVYFLLGTMVSAFLIDRPLQQGKKPHYALVMGIVGGALVLAGLMGYTGAFGPFGEVVRLKRDYFLLVLLCLASGLQNAAITISSAGTVRATHLTGPTTDMGIGMIRALFLSPGSERRKMEMRVVRLRFGMICSFILGSIAGAALFLQIGYLGFFLPALLSFYTVFIVLKQHGRFPLGILRIRDTVSEP